VQKPIYSNSYGGSCGDVLQSSSGYKAHRIRNPAGRSVLSWLSVLSDIVGFSANTIQKESALLDFNLFKEKETITERRSVTPRKW